MKQLLFIITLIFSLGAFAHDKGNGGYSVTCRIKNEIVSAELLDLYEGRSLYRKSYKLASRLNAQKIFELAADRLVSFNLRDEFLKELHLAQSRVIFIPKGHVLELTEDAFPVSRKKGCKFEQLAIYTDEQELFISTDIYSRMRTIDQAALFVHEAIYAMRRKRGDLSSKLSRKIVSELLADVPKQLPLFLNDDVCYSLPNGVFKRASNDEGSIIISQTDVKVTARGYDRILPSGYYQAIPLSDTNTYLLRSSGSQTFLKVLSDKAIMIGTEEELLSFNGKIFYQVSIPNG